MTKKMTINTQRELSFDGPDYVPSLDFERLTGQLRRIFDCMKDGRWRTLNEIEEITGDGQASISAQLRHLRKARFGSHEVEKRRRGALGSGWWEYRLEENLESGGVRYQQ